MNQTQKKNIASGFTLGEIIVVMAVLAFLAATLFSGWSNVPHQRNNVKEEITTVLNLFSNARNMAITSTTIEKEVDGEMQYLLSRFGYGVHVDINEEEVDGKMKNITVFTLFADINPLVDGEKTSYGNGKYDPLEDHVINQYSAFQEGVYNTIDTEVTLVSRFDPSDNKVIKKNSGDSNEMTILFAPLTADPTLLFDNDPDQINFSDLEIFIRLEGVIEDKITFNTVSRFFEQEITIPSL
jgi:type II secretory pathway pseudopilin PulG